jgi:hypothetical protein
VRANQGESDADGVTIERIEAPETGACSFFGEIQVVSIHTAHFALTLEYLASSGESVGEFSGVIC